MPSPGRGLSLLLATAVLTAGGRAAYAQGQATWREVESTQEADRIEWVAGAPPAAPAGLGGFPGAVRGASPGVLPAEDLLVLQAGPAADARITVRVAREEQGRLSRQVWDLRAERLVVFLDRRQGPQGLPGPPGRRPRGARGQVTPRAVYAEGNVRLVLEDSRRGAAAVEASQGWLDVAGEEAWLRDATLRARPLGGVGLPGQLQGAIPVVRAAWIRMHGAARAVAEEATITACDLADPHYLLGARRIELLRDEDLPAPSRGLLAGFLQRGGLSTGGSDALRRELALPRDVRVEGTWVEVLGVRVPALPFLGWNTQWPLPRVRVGQSSRLGVLAVLGLRYELGQVEAPLLGRLDLTADSQVEHYSRRGTGGEQALLWTRHRADGRKVGEGALRGWGIVDRGEQDRVGTPVPTEGRFWMRGLVREELPGGGQLDAEASRISDRGVLLEYFRPVAQTEKEQETYVHTRWAWDALSYRALARWRLNDFQTQVERLPEVRLDWVHLPLLIVPPAGGLYLDLTLRAGHLRFRPDDALGLESYRAGRGDLESTLSWKTSLGPMELRAWGTARQTVWSGQAGDEDRPIDRFLGEAGWSLATTLWRDFDTPWTVLRHEVVPEVGTRHRFHVTRDPSELLAFDPEVEQLWPTDHLFLRVRTRLSGDVSGLRRTWVDLSVESRWFPRDRGQDQARTWGPLLWDLRLNPTTWLTLRLRAEQDLNRGQLVTFDASTTVRPVPALEVSASYREREGGAQAVAWGLGWQLTENWWLGLEQQWDLRGKEFLYHRARLVRTFHCFALELTVSHDPQQDDTAASVSVGLAPPGPAAQDPFLLDRYRDLYR